MEGTLSEREDNILRRLYCFHFKTNDLHCIETGVYKHMAIKTGPKLILMKKLTNTMINIPKNLEK